MYPTFDGLESYLSYMNEIAYDWPLEQTNEEVFSESGGRN